MSNIGIQGIGIIFPGGKWKSDLNDFIYSGKHKLSKVKIPLCEEEKKAFLIDGEIFANSLYKSKLRKADPLALYSLESANYAIKDSKIQYESHEIGLIFSTALGSLTASFEYQDSILTFGEKEPSPTKFSHSLHNSSSSYLTSILNIKGPCVTISNFHNSFINGLITAKSWLNEEKCKYVLLGATDIYNSYAGYIFNEFFYSRDAQKKDIILGEGSVFFILEKTNTPNYCFIDFHDENETKKSDLNIIANFQPLNNINEKGADFSSFLGFSAILDAFSCACGISILKEQNNIHSDFLNNENNFLNQYKSINILRYINTFLPYIRIQSST